MRNFLCITILSGLVPAVIFAVPAQASEISISNPVAHVEVDDHHGTTIGVFMNIDNVGVADRIYAVRSNVSKSGQMSGGIDKRTNGHGDHLIATVINVAANGRTELRDVGRHVMLKDLKTNVLAGDTIEVTLFFEVAGPVKIDVPVEMEDH